MTVKYTSVWLFLLLCFILNAPNLQAAVSVGIKPAPDWLVPVTPAGNPPSTRDFSDGYYISFKDRQVNLAKKITYAREIREISSESGVQNGTTISVVFDPSFEKVDFHRITVWRNNKPVSELKNTDFKVIPVESDRQRFIYNGSYSVSVTWNGGDFVSCRFCTWLRRGYCLSNCKAD